MQHHRNLLRNFSDKHRKRLNDCPVNGNLLIKPLSDTVFIIDEHSFISNFWKQEKNR
jgi:hypothetical protein